MLDTDFKHLNSSQTLITYIRSRHSCKIEYVYENVYRLVTLLYGLPRRLLSSGPRQLYLFIAPLVFYSRILAMAFERGMVSIVYIVRMYDKYVAALAFCLLSC